MKAPLFKQSSVFTPKYIGIKGQSSHDNIVKYIGSYFLPGSYFIIMEFCDKGNLETYIVSTYV